MSIRAPLPRRAPLSRGLLSALLAGALAMGTGAGVLRAEDRYQQAAPQVRAVLDAPAPPSVRVPSVGAYALATRTLRYPPIAELARPLLKLAGVRIDPENRSHHGQRHVVELSMLTLADGVMRPVALPAGARVDDIQWNAAGTKAAFTVVDDGAVQLWLLDAKTAKARRVGKLALNPMIGEALQWMPDGQSLLVQLVVPGAPPKAAPAPAGPRIESSAKAAAASSTYESRDLLRTPHEADLFEHYATSQLAIVEASGRTRKLGAPAVYGNTEVSPDGRYLLVHRIERPYSLTRAYWRFPTDVEVWDLRGHVVETIAELPLADAVPVDGVRVGPRDVGWRPTAASTLVWAEAQDGGDTYKKVAHHDRVITKPVGKPATTWFETTQRFGGIAWLDDGKHALVSEVDRDRHRLLTKLIEVDGSAAAARTVWDRSYDDRYGDPGVPVFRVSTDGSWLVQVDRGAIYLVGDGATPEGDRPFLDRLDLATLATERLFRSDATGVERFARWVDPVAGTFLTLRETPDMPRNLVTRTLGAPVTKPGKGDAVRSSTAVALTHFEDPTPQLRAVTKKLVKYERADGVPLSFTLYLPPGYKEGTRLPTVFWAYPLDYTDKSHAGQVDAAPQEYTAVVGPSPIFLALQGYAVLDNVSMPVVGPTQSAYDDFLPQVEANAKAAIDKAVELGVTDRERVGVMGHSHGGLMTANLLAWTDLFRAGVARSGAYNHTMRPFGFQNERRSLYQAPQTYLQLSPVVHAERIDEPLLIIHGEIDANPGTVPLQSEKLFEAVRGVGGTTRLVMLPFESHGYVARESVEHVIAETTAWFDQHVKDAGPRKPKPKVAMKPTPAAGAKPAVAKPTAAAKPAAAAAKPCEPDRRRGRRAKRRAPR